MPANSRADPQNKGAAMGGLRFYLRTPLPTPETQKQGGIGRAAVLPVNSHADTGKKKGQHGCAAASPVNLHAVPKTKKTRTRKRKKIEQLTTKVPGQLLTLVEHAWRPFGYDQGNLGCLRSCSCLVGLGCSVCVGVVWLVGVFGA